MDLITLKQELTQEVTDLNTKIEQIRQAMPDQRVIARLQGKIEMAEYVLTRIQQ